MNIKEAKRKFNENRDVDAADEILKAAVAWAMKMDFLPQAAEIAESFRPVVNGKNITKKRQAAAKVLPLLERVNVC